MGEETEDILNAQSQTEQSLGSSSDHVFQTKATFELLEQETIANRVANVAAGAKLQIEKLQAAIAEPIPCGGMEHVNSFWQTEKSSFLQSPNVEPAKLPNGWNLPDFWKLPIGVTGSDKGLTPGHNFPTAESFLAMLHLRESSEKPETTTESVPSLLAHVRGAPELPEEPEEPLPSPPSQSMNKSIANTEKTKEPAPSPPGRLASMLQEYLEGSVASTCGDIQQRTSLPNENKTETSDTDQELTSFTAHAEASVTSTSNDAPQHAISYGNQGLLNLLDGGDITENRVTMNDTSRLIAGMTPGSPIILYSDTHDSDASNLKAHSQSQRFVDEPEVIDVTDFDHHIDSNTSNDARQDQYTPECYIIEERDDPLAPQLNVVHVEENGNKIVSFVKNRTLHVVESYQDETYHQAPSWGMKGSQTDSEMAESELLTSGCHVFPSPAGSKAQISGYRQSSVSNLQSQSGHMLQTANSGPSAFTSLAQEEIRGTAATCSVPTIALRPRFRGVRSGMFNSASMS